MKYHEFKAATIVCKKCGWRGVGSEMDVGEVFERGGISEYHCPKCGDYWGAIPWPEIAEAAPRVDRRPRNQHVLDEERERRRNVPTSRSWLARNLVYIMIGFALILVAIEHLTAWF